MSHDGDDFFDYPPSIEQPFPNLEPAPAEEAAPAPAAAADPPDPEPVGGTWKPAWPPDNDPDFDGDEPRPLLKVDLDLTWGTYYLNFEAPETRWLLTDSLPRHCLGAVIAPPGTGKGFLALQLSAALAAGRDFMGFWSAPHPFRVLYVSAEESQAVVHERAKLALLRLPPEARREAGNRLWAWSVSGAVHLVEGDERGGLRPTGNFFDLKKTLGTLRPEVLILDTLARFCPVEENNNQLTTMVCALLETLAADHNLNVIVLHHTNKAGGVLSGSAAEMKSALSQTSIRGASALAASIRWGLLMTPLGADFAAKLMGPEARGAPEGAFVALRVAKKNQGRGEPTHFLRHGDGGLFDLAEPDGGLEEARQEEIDRDAHKLAQEVRKRELWRAKPLSVSRGGAEAFGWGTDRARRAADWALRQSLLISVKKESGNGWILKSVA